MIPSPSLIVSMIEFEFFDRKESQMQELIQQPTIELPLSFPAECQQIVSNPDLYAILDTETTGPRYGGEVCDLAIVDPAGKVLFNSLLKPICKIDPETSAFHGITNEMVADAPTFAESWPAIHAAIGTRVLLVYNVKFDRPRLEHTAREHGVPFVSREWQCVMLRYAEFYGAPNQYGYASAGWQKLEAALPQQGVPFVQEHRALSDALAVVALIQRLAELGDAAARWTGNDEE